MYAWFQWNRQFETSFIEHKTMGRLTKNRSRYNKKFSDQMWQDKNGYETPPINYFNPGNLYNHPSIVNYLKHIGGRPRNVFVEELNKHPDRSVIAFLKGLLKA